MAVSAQAARRPVRWPNRGDLTAVIVLGVVPLVWFGVPALVGHPLIPGDDLVQNFPLRVLVGQQLRHGTLPVYDPYIWSGSPLLGGWNAGAFYPFTFLFAVVPATLAWTINECLVYWVAALGLYGFLRTMGRRPMASFLAAMSFAFAGPLDVHLPHFGLVAGTSWAPLILLATVKVARAQTTAARFRWSAVFGLGGALVVLAGEPRAIDTVVIVTLIFVVWTALRRPRPAVPFIGAVGVGLVVAALVSAVQWLPGVTAVSTSQRALNTYALYGSGSLPWRWLGLAFVPGVLGGSGSFGTAGWLTGYNLPEVMSYVGLLPVAAAFGLLGTVRRRLPDWFVWYVVAAVGVVLALGANTPLGHLLVHVPLFGSQRLQSRNIALTDLALVVLLAYGVDHLLDRVPDDGRGAGVRGRRRFAAAALVPLVGAVALGVSGVVSPEALARLADATAGHAVEATAQRPLFVVSVLFAVVLGTLVVRSDRMSLPRLTRLLVIFVTADLLFFNLTSVWSVATRLGQGPAPAVDAFARGTSAVPLHLPAPPGTAGRFVIYDPPSYNQSALHTLGQPDVNLTDATFSAQGYSSIVNGPYAQATGSHAAVGQGTNDLVPGALVNGVFDSLDTTTLVTLPRYLVVAGGGPRPTATGNRPVAAGGRARWVFGEQIRVASVAVRWKAAAGAAAPVPGAGSWRVALEEPGGRLEWLPVTVTTSSSGALAIGFARPAAGIGLVVQTIAAGTFGAPVVRTVPGDSFDASGDLQDALATGHWTFAGDRGPFAYYTNNRARPPLTVRAIAGTGAGEASVGARTGPRLDPTSAWVSSTHGAEVIRAVAAIPGWSATWRPRGRGPALALAVRSSGIVQAVDVPAGRGVVTWRYTTPGLTAGAWCTVGGVLLLLVMWRWPAIGGRRWRRPRPPLVEG